MKAAARREDNVELVEDLLKISDIEVNAKDSQGRTALMHAIVKGNRNITKLLLNHPDIQVNTTDNKV